MRSTWLQRWITAVVMACSVGAVQAEPPAAAPACANRGALDAAYCDADNDLVADPSPAITNPSRLMVGISSVEDAMTARKTYIGFVEYLSGCLRREVLLHPLVGEPAVLEGLRTGQIHIGQTATGTTMYAVNFAGGVPFAAKGSSAVGKHDSYTLMLIVRADSSYRKPTELKGKKIAHSSQTSNSGNLAPRALFPAQGLTPDKDYTVEYSGKHDKSIMGVALGLYDGAAVASDVLDRLVAKGDVKRNQFRVIYESEPFPPDAFLYHHDLAPALVNDIRRCFADYKFPEIMVKALEGNDRFFPINYENDWRVVRQISKASGVPMTHEAYQKLVTPKR